MTVLLDAASNAAASRPDVDTRKCILVLGMHRSGTSATARVLSLLGARLPKRIIGPGPGNEAGHWEPAALVAAHDRMLAEVGSRWDDWRKLDLGRLRPTRQDQIRAELTGLIEEEYGDAPITVLKDPRICRFVPLYAELLAHAAAEPCCVLPLRNPLAVIASLKARDGMSDAFAGLLWLRHVLEAEASTRDWPRAIVSYEDLVTDWQTVIGRISAQLGISWPVTLDEVGLELSEFLSAALQHHSASPHDLASRGGISGWVKTAYEALLCLERNPDDDLAISQLDRIRSELDAACPYLGEAIFAELAARESRFLAAQQRLTSEADKRIASLQSFTRRLEHSEAVVKREAEELRRTIAALNDSLAERDLRVDRGLRQIAEMKSSLSWHITSPARQLNRQFQRADSTRLRLKLAAAVRHPASSQNRKAYRARKLPSLPTAASTRPARDVLQPDYAIAVPFDYISAASPADGSVAAVLHIYYDDLAEELCEYLANIPGSPDLFISTTNELKKERICRGFESWPGNIQIKVVENRGRDIAPKLITFREVYDRYDYVLHAHTKRSPHNSALADWRTYLLKTLLGSPQIVSSIFDAFSRNLQLGMVAPQHFTPLSEAINWGSNFPRAAGIARKMQLDLQPDATLDFPSGSMFWARSAAFRSLLDLDLRLDEFDDEEGQLDGTLAHAVERLFFIACEKSGFDWMKIARPELRDDPCSTIRASRPSDLDDFLSRHKVKLLASETADGPERAPMATKGVGKAESKSSPDTAGPGDATNFCKSQGRSIKPSEAKRVSYQSFPGQKGSSDSMAKLEAIRLPDLTGKSFLDIGCNEGFFCGEALRRGASRVVGIDASEESIRRAKARFPDIDFRCQTWDRLPDEEFDVIIMLSALHYEPRPRELMARIAQRLKPNGRFILEAGVSLELAKLWFEVPRGVGPVDYPTSRLLLENVLADFAARQIGPSVTQAGDPLPRFVYHCRKLAPTFLIVSGPSGSGKSTFTRQLSQLGADVLEADLALVRARDFEIKSSEAAFNSYLATLDHLRIKTWIDEIREPKLAAAVGRFLFHSAPKEKSVTIAEGYAFEHPLIREAFLQCLDKAGFRYWITSSGNLADGFRLQLS